MDDRQGAGPDDLAEPRVLPSEVDREGFARRARLPHLSGKATAAVVFACLALGAAVALPLTRRLPLWIRFETALSTWWLVWVVTLTRILYVAASVEDDHVLGRFRWWFSKKDGGRRPRGSDTADGDDGDSDAPAPARRAATGAAVAGAVAVAAGAAALRPSVGRRSVVRTQESSSWLSGLDSLDLDFEGCGAAIVAIVGLVLLVASLWLLVEIVIPVLAFAAYALLRGMLAAAARFGDRCQGRLGAAVGWAVAFATLYVAPLAGAVWLGHVLRAARAA